IGTDPSGDSGLGNMRNGVYANATSGLPGPSSNRIGGTTPGARNVIANNGGDGVQLDAGLSNAVRANPIFGNGLLQIDLKGDGISPNDAGDADSGPNNMQNFPNVSAAASDATSTGVRGTLSTTPVVGTYS